MAAIEHRDDALAPQPDPLAEGGLDRLAQEMLTLAGRCREHHRTHVEPCVIRGERTLVHERGLRDRAPKLFAYLKRFAKRNAVALQEDRRVENAPVRVDRRRKLAPLVALVASMLAPPLAASPPEPAAAPGGVKVAFGTRAHLPIRDAGKRFASGPHGSAAQVLEVAVQTRRHGAQSVVSTDGMTVPNRSSNQRVTRYDFEFPAECGGERFSYFEGQGFHALGHHQGDKVIVDVLVGGGPFTAPRLWGPFDQVLNDSVEMHLLVGSGEEDGFGLMKASYSVGMVAAMSAGKAAGYGDRYEDATVAAANCALPASGPEPASPTLVEAAAPAPPALAAILPRTTAPRSGARPAAPRAVAPREGESTLEDGTLSAEVSPPQGRMLYGARDHLPLRDDGARFADGPFGGSRGILAVADEVKARGHAVRASTRNMKIPNQTRNRWVTRYDYTFPGPAGGARFSLYEGRDFRALGLHIDDRIVLDVIEGGVFSAPRLWGTYDQVLNDSGLRVHLLVGDGQADGFGLLKASFMAGIVSKMPKAKQRRYGNAYRDAVASVARTLDPFPEDHSPTLRQAIATVEEPGS